MKKPTILFSTYGGHNLGTGHVFRDLELAKVLMRDVDVFFHVNGANGAFDILSERGVKHILRGKLKRVLKELDPKLLIYDKPYALGEMEDIGQENGMRVISLDSFFYDDGRIDASINIINHHYKKRRKDRGQRVYEGTQYSIIRDDILKGRKRRKNRKDIRNILVTFGGGDPRNNTEKVIRMLNNFDEQRFNVQIIRGYIFRKRLAYSLSRGNHDYSVKNKVKDMSALMDWADVAFCGGGTTSMELLCVGCPIVVFPQTKEELAFAKSVADKKALLLIEPGLRMDRAKKKVKKVIEDRSLRNHLSKNGQKLFDGKGKERIKKIVLRSLKGS